MAPRPRGRREARATPTAQSPSRPAAEPELHRSRQLRGVQPAAEFDVVAARRRRAAPGRRASSRCCATRCQRVGQRVVLWCSPPWLTRQAMVSGWKRDAPRARTRGDALVAPVPAVAQQRGLGDEVDRHAAQQRVFDRSRQRDAERGSPASARLRRAALRLRELDSLRRRRRSRRAPATAPARCRSDRADPRGRPLRAGALPGQGWRRSADSAWKAVSARCQAGLVEQRVEETVDPAMRPEPVASGRIVGLGSRWPGDAAPAGPARAMALQKRSICSLALGLETEQVAYTIRPPGFSRGHSARAVGPGCGPARDVVLRGAASERRDGGERCPRRCTARRAGCRRRAGRPTSRRFRASPA